MQAVEEANTELETKAKTYLADVCFATFLTIVSLFCSIFEFCWQRCVALIVALTEGKPKARSSEIESIQFIEQLSCLG